MALPPLGKTLAAFFAARPDLPVVSAYLFGSHAEGRAHRESDVDIAVLLDWSRAGDRAERFAHRVRLGSELIAALHHNEVDVVLLNDAPPLFGRRIVHEGQRVFCRDPELDRAFVRDVQLRAGDLAPSSSATGGGCWRHSRDELSRRTVGHVLPHLPRRRA